MTWYLKLKKWSWKAQITKLMGGVWYQIPLLSTSEYVSKTYLFGLLFNYQNLKFTIVQINILRCILEECCWRLMNTCNDCQHAVSIGMLNVYVFIFWNPVIVVFPWKLTNAVTMKICGERWFSPSSPLVSYTVISLVSVCNITVLEHF